MWIWGRKIDLVEINGGLGNQMFQYSYAIYLQYHAHPNHQIYLDLSTILDYKKHNGWELDRVFGCTIASLPIQKINDIKRERKRFRLLKIVHETKECFYAPVNYRGSKRVRLHIGYWQNEGYLLPVEERIRKAFEFDLQKLSAQTLSIASQIAQPNSVAIHIRRGDYVNESASAAVHGAICTEKYYHKAIELIQQKLPSDPHFYLFSDDPQWVEESFHLPHQTIVCHNRAADSWQDMYLFSQCQHHIIANSSFSWWGAWLSLNPNKIVIAPSIWFNQRQTDIVPPHWTQINPR